MVTQIQVHHDIFQARGVQALGVKALQDFGDILDVFPFAFCFQCQRAEKRPGVFWLRMYKEGFYDMINDWYGPTAHP